MNLLWTWTRGRKAPDNPWESTTLEWATTSPPPYENFAEDPVVHHGPYEYSVPGAPRDYVMQNDPATIGAGHHGARR